jgi:nascent polypeptide-associated complex subunit alpha
MFPGGMNPKQMKQMMSRMGIKSDEIPADRVIIEGGGKKTIIEGPEVMKMTVQGQVVYNITGGKVRSEEAEAIEDTSGPAEISEEDVDLVSQQTGVSREDARKAIEDSNGDLAEAIIKIKG